VLRGVAVVPLCGWLNRESLYVKLFLISVELSILISHMASKFIDLPSILIEAILIFSTVTYSQFHIAQEHFNFTSSSQFKAFQVAHNFCVHVIDGDVAEQKGAQLDG